MLNPIVFNARYGYGDFCGYPPHDHEFMNSWDTYICVRWDSADEVAYISADECDFIASWFDVVCD